MRTAMVVDDEVVAVRAMKGVFTGKPLGLAGCWRLIL